MLLATHFISHVAVRHQGMMRKREIIMKKSLFKDQHWDLKNKQCEAYSEKCLHLPNLQKLSSPCSRLIVLRNKPTILFLPFFCSKVLLGNLDLKALSLTALLLSFRISLFCINDCSVDSLNIIWLLLPCVDLLGKCKDNLSWESDELIAYGSYEYQNWEI